MFMIFVETDPNDQTDVDNEVFTAALKEMVSLGIDITRIIHQQVVAQSIDSPHNPIPEATSLAFERVSRAVRRSIMLAKKLRSPPAQSAASPALAGEKRGEGARKRETNAQKDQDPRDRPDSPDRLETLDERPTIELINEIRQDLNLPPLPPAAQSKTDDPLLPLPRGEGGASKGSTDPLGPWNARGGRGEGQPKRDPNPQKDQDPRERAEDEGVTHPLGPPNASEGEAVTPALDTPRQTHHPPKA